MNSKNLCFYLILAWLIDIVNINACDPLKVSVLWLTGLKCEHNVMKCFSLDVRPKRGIVLAIFN